MRLTITPESAMEDHGTVIVFAGTTEDGRIYRFACDRRPALVIINDLQSGEADGIPIVEAEVEVEDWQILSQEA